MEKGGEIMNIYISLGKMLAERRMIMLTDEWVSVYHFILENYQREFPAHTTSWFRELCYS